MTARPDAGQLTPAQIVAELDRYVVGQGQAKQGEDDGDAEHEKKH